MLNRYVERNGFQPIPWTGNRFLITMEGDFLDTIRNQTSYRGKNDLLEIFDGKYWLKLKRSVLVALVFKNSKVPLSHWKWLDTLAIDGNDENTHASNLIWLYPEDGLRVNSTTDFSYVPGFSRYSVSKNGTVFSHVTGKVISPYQDKMGYWMYGCQPDVGKRTIIGMHRLLGLAFLRYTADVDRLDVNHRDGCKENCAIDNLEWGSRKHNCDHAYSNGLRDDNIVVSVKNSFNGEVKNYYSLEECGRQLNVDGETIRLRIKTRGQAIYPPGLQFKRSDDVIEWKTFDNPALELLRNGLPREVVAISEKDGSEIQFKTLQACANFLAVKRATLGWRLVHNPDKAINGFKVSYAISKSKKKSH